MKPTILIVDDRRENLDHLAMVLSEAGLEILEAESGTRALAIAHTMHPDAILIDIVMPGMDGIVLCRSLKAIPELAEIPILMITAVAGEEQQVEAFSAGAVGVLTRPLLDAVLIANLLSVIKQADDELASPKSEIDNGSACLVQSIMSRDVARASRDSPLEDLAKTMAERRLSCLLVCHEGRPVGIVSERDIVGVLARSSSGEASISSMTAGDVMSSPLVTVKERSTLGMANFKVSQHPIRRLPAVDERGQLVGIVTQSDMVHALAHEVERRRTKVNLEVAKRTAELEARVKSLETGDKFKTEFLAHMSHEIRTPMTAVIGFAESLADSAGADGEVAEAARTILESGRYILELVNEILDLSKIEAGKLELNFRRASPFEIVESVAKLMRDRARDKNLELSVEYEGELPEWFETDAMRLRQILINLTGNAIKFTHRGMIRLGVQYRAGESPEARPCLEFAILDTGIGISEEQLNKLFKPFTQAEASTAAEFGGTGLGLSISRDLARMLGGDIVVSSEAGTGTEFTVRIELEAASEAPLLSYEQYTANQKSARTGADVDAEAIPHIPYKLLLVEDTRTNQIVIERLLRKAGAEVEIATNGQIAVEMAQAALANDEPYAVILMDTQMPVMDGREATRLLRSEGYDLPIVALTASAMEKDRRLCLEAGCDDVATKPIIRLELISTIKTYADSKLRREAEIERIAREVESTRVESPQEVASLPDPEPQKLELTDLEQDMLGEIFNLGLGVAGAALSEMTQEEVQLMAPRVAFVERGEVARILEHELSSELSAVRQDFRGSFDGEAVLVFAQEKILGLVSSVMGDAIPSDLTQELEEDVLAEAGNIILGACMATFTDHLQLDLTPSVPRVIYGSGSHVLATEAASDTSVLLVAIDFRIESREISGFVSFILDTEATHLLIAAVDAHIKRLGLDF